jgi:hypothetical protein
MARSVSAPLTAFGDAGLKGPNGEVALSFPPFDRMANDREDDFGIFLRGFLSVSEGYCYLSTGISWSNTVTCSSLVLSVGR